MAKTRLRRTGTMGVGTLLIAIGAVVALAVPASAAPVPDTFEIESGTLTVNDLPPNSFSGIDPCFMGTEVDTDVDSIRQLEVNCGPITSDLGFTFSILGGEVATAGSYSFSSATEGTISLPFSGGAELDSGCFIGPIDSGTSGPFLEGPFSTADGVTSATISAVGLPVPAIQADDDCPQSEADNLNALIGLPGVADVSFTGSFADFPLS